MQNKELFLLYVFVKEIASSLCPHSLMPWELLIAESACKFFSVWHFLVWLPLLNAKFTVPQINLSGIKVKREDVIRFFRLENSSLSRVMSCLCLPMTLLILHPCTLVSWYSFPLNKKAWRKIWWPTSFLTMQLSSYKWVLNWKFPHNLFHYLVFF